MQGISRAVDIAGRVGEYDLVFRFIDKADDTVACGLRLRRNNGKALTYEGIHEGRLTYVWQTYYIDKSGFMHGCKLLVNALTTKNTPKPPKGGLTADAYLRFCFET